ncbi:MAG: BadF/BadG/BcrA/BcrD ATPase family protein [Kiritimatiellia bacterium]|nr:BadF/BadG/BcrA/BcrD ATPase family protein [Kiritimatiellia bacterium]
MAFDPGGTKCHALLVRGDGQALGWGTGEGPDLSGRSEEAFRMAARDALAYHVPAAVVMVNAHPRLMSALGKQGIPVRSTSSVSESEAAFALAGQSCGLIVLAGTGSFVHGKTSAGRELHLDGAGPVLGDTGSAYFIGLMALRAAAKSDWHPRFHTNLQNRLYAFYGLTNLDNLIAFSLKPMDRSVIAAFARVVDEEAAAGDPVAVHILISAADDIVDILQAVIDRLEMTRESYAMIGTGSVIMHSFIYWTRLCERAKRFAPLLTPMRSPRPPVLGVALASLRREQGLNYDQAAATLLATYKEIMK